MRLAAQREIMETGLIEGFQPNSTVSRNYQRVESRRLVGGNKVVQVVT